MGSESRSGVRVYTRPGCHLCRTALNTVEELLERYPVPFQVFDVERDPALAARYGPDVPVVEVETPLGIRTFRHHVDPEELREEVDSLWNR